MSAAGGEVLAGPVGEGERAAWVREVVQRHHGALPHLTVQHGLSCTDVGDGNMNFVYRVSGADGSSVIVKHTPPYIRCLGAGYALTAERLRAEHEALVAFDRLAPGLCPKPLCFDAEANMLVMEDLVGYRGLREDLLKGCVSARAAEQCGAFVARVQAGTKAAPVMENAEMVALTKQYVFLKPLDPTDETNSYAPELDEAVAELRGDAGVCGAVRALADVFDSKHEALAHGDLHTGSVMVNSESDIRVIDAEFAFTGPLGLDLGMLTAHYLFSCIRHRKSGELQGKHAEAVRRLWAGYRGASSGQSDEVVARVLGEALGFAGCDLMRRVIGPAKVEDIKGDVESERCALRLARFLLARHASLDLEDVVAFVAEL